MRLLYFAIVDIMHVLLKKEAKILYLVIVDVLIEYSSLEVYIM